MLTGIKIYFQLLVNQSVSKTSETTNRMISTETKIPVHFYNKFQDIIIIFHDFPWPWLFSMTFQAWKMVLLNSMTLQEEWSRCLEYGVIVHETADAAVWHKSAQSLTVFVRDDHISRESKTTRNVLWSRASVCLSAAACPHYCMDPDVTWGTGRGCPLVVH